MKYRDFARSPNYGRIISYDAFGNEVDNIDVLKIQVQNQRGELFTIGELLGTIDTINKANRDLETVNKGLKEDIKNTQKMLVEQNKRLGMLQEAITVLAQKVDSNKI